MNDSVFSMIRQVLSDSQEKVAAAKAQAAGRGIEKTAEPVAPIQEPSGEPPQDFLKIAEACEFLADNLHDVVDGRSPQEKLAELVATQDALRKMAAEGDADLSSAHQTQKANSENDPPMAPSLDGGIAPGGPSSAMKTEPSADGGGGESLDAGQGGQATPAHVTPKDTTPSEKPNPQDASNAMDTNKEMMMPEQPEDVLKQAAAHFGIGVDEFQEKVAITRDLLEKAAASGSPASLTLAMIRATGDDVVTKLAEDAIYPAKISGGTEPLLQSSPGTPSALNQGAEAGENTPRETAPTTGQGSGREALSSNEAAINLTKGKAKAPQKGPLGEVLTEPALSSAHDSVLQKSLDNASSAGVKISAAKELLRKFASQSPENANLVRTIVKMAEEGDLPEEVAPAALPEEAALPEGQEEAPSDEALEAALAGVTPEELEMALAMQQAQGAQAAEADEAAAAAEEAAAAGAPAEGAPPMGGAAPEEVAKASQGMGMPMSAGANIPPSAQGAM